VSLSVVIPCYRSAATLPDLVRRLATILPAIAHDYEVILVVDGSPDYTWDVAQVLAAEHTHVRALHLSRNYGQHNALLAGVRLARFETVITMDDDLQHPPEELPRLVAALTHDLDLVYAIAEHEEHGVLRSLASRTLKAGLAAGLGVRSARSISAFRIFRTFLRNGFAEFTGPHASLDVALSWATTRVGAVRVRMVERHHGRSTYTPRALFGHAATMLTGYSTAPLRAVTYLGLACGTLGAVLLGTILWKYYAGETTVAGFTTLASMIALFSGAQMLAIGVVGEYVGRLHSAGSGRPTYVLREEATGTGRREERTIGR
jgi:glycosyltransferase involved in cell wall biosynthesis